MSAPPLSKGVSLMARNKDETKGSLSNPGKGNRDEETNATPRQTLPALGIPHRGGRPPLLNRGGCLPPPLSREIGFKQQQPRLRACA